MTALGVDAGQTATRAALGDGHRGQVAAGGGVRRLQGDATAGEVAALLAEAIGGVGPLPRPGPPTGVGLSGFEAATEPQLREIAERLRAAGAGPLAVASDGLTALRHADGRGGSATLLDSATTRYGAVERLPAAIYGAPSPTGAVAAFAADVAAAARAGDADAVAIVADAGRELATSAAAALDRLFEPDAPAAVSHSGNVFRAGPALTEPFERALAELRPSAELASPVGDALSGAQALARLAPGLPITPGILWRTQ